MTRISLLSLSDKSTADVMECADVDYATGSCYALCTQIGEEDNIGPLLNFWVQTEPKRAWGGSGVKNQRAYYKTNYDME